MPNQHEELLVQVRLLQANLDVICENVERLTNSLSAHTERDGEVKTKLALVEQTIQQIKVHQEDHCKILHRGTTRDESLVAQVKSIKQSHEESLKRIKDSEESTSKRIEKKIAIIGLIISMIATFAAIIIPFFTK